MVEELVCEEERGNDNNQVEHLAEDEPTEVNVVPAENSVKKYLQ